MYVIIYMHKGEVISSRVDYETFPNILDTITVDHVEYSVRNMSKRYHDSEQIIIVICDVAISN